MANLAALTHGATVVIPAESFDPEATLRAIEAQRCTSIYGVPTMFIDMLGHPLVGSVGLDSLRTGIMAGSPCPIEVMRQVIERMHVREVTICYGMTETSPSLSSLPWMTDRRSGVYGPDSRAPRREALRSPGTAPRDAKLAAAFRATPWQSVPTESIARSSPHRDRRRPPASRVCDRKSRAGVADWSSQRQLVA